MDELTEAGWAMQPAPIPPDDIERLVALWDTGLLDTPPAAVFDRITRSVAVRLRVPMAAVTLVDQHRQWFLSRVGLPMAQTPRDISFCGHAVAQRRPLCVSDTHVDLRFAGNPLVMGPPYIRAYVAVPLMDEAHHALGTLCAMDNRVRDFSANEQQLLQRYARALQQLILR
ncbi:GAF domain-containing protein [Azohydromonas caseinilytica]|uniref:GAF domain-containing protein n=1 Tax=Azohydromonas caseinilytica TaxID=2728836 RepID=A0A848FBB2_9BURK|nr:GAF domain-containing protein [Azohydromonas caseinilytica]NML16176.1 GAF domain-containing protein [Azohydromonas caseinilytica]